MDMKDQKLATEIAEERMTLIAPLLSQNLDKDSVRLIRAEICERNQISQRTLERYLTSYLKGGFDALKPQSRSAIDRYLVPVSAISNSSLPGRSNIITIYFPNTKQHIALTMLVTMMNTFEYFMNTFTLA